jgi:hypothetical protein
MRGNTQEIHPNRKRMGELFRLENVMEGPTGEVPLAARNTLSSLIGGGLAIRSSPSLRLIYEVKVMVARVAPHEVCHAGKILQRFRYEVSS